MRMVRKRGKSRTFSPTPFLPFSCGINFACDFYNGSSFIQQAHCLHKDKIDEILNDVNSSSEYCLPQKTRVILLVIDALKYDFGVYNKEAKNPLAYENKLPVLQRLLDKYPRQSRFMKFVADAPTTTLQRLKGITTGSLPTFIDIGSNFATSEINEDNIIDQVSGHSHSDNYEYTTNEYFLLSDGPA